MNYYDCITVPTYLSDLPTMNWILMYVCLYIKDIVIYYALIKTTVIPKFYIPKVVFSLKNVELYIFIHATENFILITVEYLIILP